MALNCKAGDLAVYVRSMAGNEGCIVTCLRLATRAEVNREFFADVPTWVLDRPMPSSSGRLLPLAADFQLRPIRDPGDDAQDETLLWKPVPASNPKTPEPV